MTEKNAAVLMAKRFIYLLLALMLLPVTSNAEIYKWVDKNGRVHYDDKPPVTGQKELMNINEESNAVKGLTDDRAEKRKTLLDAIDEDRQLKKEKEAKAKKKKTKLNKQCHRAKDGLKRYERSASVYDLDKDGNRVTLPGSVRDKIIADLKKKIAENCK